MLKRKLMLLALTGAVASCNAAAPSVEDNIKKLLAPRIGGGVKIESVKATPYAGLYEVRAGGDIIYTDKKGEFIFVGQVYNARTSENLTKARLDEINKINFADLPTQHALKMVKGNGKRVIAIFEDPNCGYCKQFRKTTLKEIDNVTVYTYMLNILSEDSTVKSRNIWCSPDRNKAWDEWMLNNKLPAAAPADCKTPLDQISELGRKYRINGTPAIFFTDGTRIAGAIDTAGLEAKFKTVK
ncbi:DsbC family protein [Massilia sp. PAMC28688]|uniref:DsbC family protein n=1 Tax=Massilia sp. PAMC28688 TaxID=2861283 RepID=UPI001C62DE04|nr:DsbC family protein [Massilia sp. PAMC28688]QYF94629.1 DsbC family protein [Massilia sp. PAMC28688]